MVLVQRPRRPRGVNRRSSGCRPGAWELVAPGRRSRFPGPRHGPRACIAPPLLARPRPVIFCAGTRTIWRPVAQVQPVHTRPDQAWNTELDDSGRRRQASATPPAWPSPQALCSSSAPGPTRRRGPSERWSASFVCSRSSSSTRWRPSGSTRRSRWLPPCAAGVVRIAVHANGLSASRPDVPNAVIDQVLRRRERRTSRTPPDCPTTREFAPARIAAHAGPLTRSGAAGPAASLRAITQRRSLRVAAGDGEQRLPGPGDTEA